MEMQELILRIYNTITPFQEFTKTDFLYVVEKDQGSRSKYVETIIMNLLKNSPNYIEVISHNRFRKLGDMPYEYINEFLKNYHQRRYKMKKEKKEISLDVMKPNMKSGEAVYAVTPQMLQIIEQKFKSKNMKIKQLEEKILNLEKIKNELKDQISSLSNQPKLITPNFSFLEK
jgi:hypothetical protein